MGVKRKRRSLLLWSEPGDGKQQQKPNLKRKRREELKHKALGDSNITEI